MTRLRERRRLGGEGGYSLAELLVVLVLFGLIGGVVATVSSTGLRKQSQVQDRNDAMAQARTAQQRISRDIRSAAAIDLAQDNDLKLVEAQTSGTWTVEYKLVADGSKWDLQAVRSDTGTTTLLRNVVSITGSPIFSYLRDPDSASVVTTSDCSQTGANAGYYAPECIGTISLDFHIQPLTLTQPVELSDSGTELRNET